MTLAALLDLGLPETWLREFVASLGLGDIGITAQRYSLVLYGNAQKLKIEPWEPETARTVTAGAPARRTT